MLRFAEESVVTASPETLSTFLEGEAVVLNLNNGQYYALNATAVEVWKMLRESPSVSALRDHLLREFDVAAAQCMQDLQATLTEMSGFGLLHVSAAAEQSK